MVKILCLIPARSGSKGIKDKNIKDFHGFPLIGWTITYAKKSKHMSNMRIIVSTDSKKYAIIANAYGAETPFQRPDEISQDFSTDYEFIKHAVDWLQTNEKYEPDFIIQLRPTQPHRTTKDIDTCIDIFLQNYQDYDSLRSVVLFEKSPYKMYTIHENIVDKPTLTPIFQEINGIKEPYNQCRQALPQTYLHNGYIDIFKTTLLEQKTISGEKIYPFVMKPEDTIDIDSPEDWEKALRRLP
jgi:CMP-N,N'-diacetyllegionaminic acid synthase